MLLTLTAVLVLGGGAVPAVASAAVAAPASPTRSSVTVQSGVLWTKAKPLAAGTALKSSTTIDPTGVNCTGSGDCVAIGTASPTSAGTTTFNSEPFVDTEANGTWKQPQKLTGFTKLTIAGLPVYPEAISCASPGNCVVGGSYDPDHGPSVREPFDPFVAVEKNGVWGPAQAMPGMAALNTQNGADVSAVACTAPGYCTVTGTYGIPYPGGADATLIRPYILDLIAGKWQAARPIPVPKTTGTDAFFADEPALSCTSPGYCTIGVSGSDNEGPRTMVETETKFKWSTEHAVSGMTDLEAIDCAAAGDCAAVGGDQVAKSSGGAWSAAATVGGSGLGLDAISCGSTGNCLAGGSTSNSTFSSSKATVLDEVNGKWGNPSSLTDVSTSSAGGEAGINALSCNSALQCQLGGTYTVGSTGTTDTGFVEELDRTAQKPVQTFKDGGVGVISCTGGSCGGLLAGSTLPNSSVQGYADFTQKLPVKTATALKLSAAKTTYGKEKTEKVSVSVGPSAPVLPTGKVRVAAGKTTVCTITLTAAKGSCVLAAKQLKPGSYTLIATYLGDVNRKSSVSPGRKLSVLK